MSSLSSFESWVLAYLLNSLWQVPLVFLAAWAAARLARPAGPRMEHRVWVGALLLQAVLPLCHWRGDMLRQAWGLVLWIRGTGAGAGETRIILGNGTASGSLPWLPAGVFAAAAAAYLCVLLYFAGRFVRSVWITESMRRHAQSIELDPEIASSIDSLSLLFGFGRGEVRFSSSAVIPGPATVGILRQTLLLPAGFLRRLSDRDMQAVLAHEFTHMRRHDFAKNLLYGIVSLPVAYHPVLALTRARLAETRELVCDAMAAEVVGGRETYARSLLRLAQMLSDRKAPRILHAIGIFDANIFERRVMHLTGKSFEIRGARRLAIAVACAAVALLTCASALALRMNVTAPTSSVPAPSSITVKPDQLKIAKKVQPVYPPDAKKARISGTVLLDAVIGKDGSVQSLRVVSGPPALLQSALDAVRQWQYEPYLLNGEPIEVKTTITIMFTLRK
jgi:TonB family protein